MLFNLVMVKLDMVQGKNKVTKQNITYNLVKEVLKVYFLGKRTPNEQNERIGPQRDEILLLSLT